MSASEQDGKHSSSDQVSAVTGDASVVDEIIKFNKDREPALARLKYERMAESAFAFFRGTDHLFARAWPAFKPSAEGPALLICGDLHLENFGAMRGGDGVLRYDINDFDEALVGPCSFDLVRCAASTLLAAEEWQLSAVPATTILWAYLSSYRAAIAETATTGRPSEITREAGGSPIGKLLGAPAVASQAELLDKRTKVKDGRRRIIRSDDKHPDVDDDRRALVKGAVQNFGAQENAADFYNVLDVTGRIAGIGSLGLPRFTVLVAGRGDEDNRLLDVKEERVSAIQSIARGPQPEVHGNDAERVVEAQRQLQGYPPDPLSAIPIGQGWFRLREMIPDENRSGLERLSHKPDKLRSAVEIAGRLTGWSHWRGAVAAKTDTAELISWAAGPGLEAVIPAAIRCAARATDDYQIYLAAYKANVRPLTGK